MVSISTVAQSTDVVIITSLIQEFQEFISRSTLFGNVKTTTFVSGIDYLLEIPRERNDGELTPYRVIITSADIGQVREKIVLVSSQSNPHSQPTILLVDVATGIAPEAELGDILLASEIIDYQPQNPTQQSYYEPTRQVYQTKNELVNLAREVAKSDWPRSISTARPRPGKINTFIGGIVSSYKPISSDSELNDLPGYNQKLIGIDMESSGLVTTIAQAELDVLMIRVVVDLIDKPAKTETPEWRNYALSAAAAFTVELVKALAKPKPTKEWVPVPPRIPVCHTDGPAGQDLLDITPDVNAFASLIASNRTPLPLSIGLFGEWGSGKTFFMKKVQAAVKNLSDEAKRSDKLQKNIGYYKRIIQIEFNAWHYVEGNLWASLVDHLFLNLRHSDLPENEVEAVRKKLLSALEIETKEKEALSEQKQIDEAALATLETSIGEKNQELENKATEIRELTAKNIFETVMALSEVQAEKNKLIELRAKLGLDRVGDKYNEMQAAIAETQAVLTNGIAVFRPLVSAEDRGKRWAWLIILLVAGPLIGLGVSWLVSLLQDQWATQISSVMMTLATWIAGAVKGLSSGTSWVSEQISKVERADQFLKARVTTQQEEINSQIAVLEKEREAINENITKTLQEIANKEERIRQLKGELERTTPGNLLTTFIQDRVDSNHYQKHLGLLAMVRKDFERISNLIDRENQELINITELEKEKANEVSRINRIVLYIDDLDRCPTNKVVQVLQAVHLLLAFPLFVVVVAVDARWISKALLEKYGIFFAQESGIANKPGESSTQSRLSATPLDYLEKIFQIPFWLSPMSIKARKDMIAGLIGKSEINGPNNIGVSGVSSINIPANSNNTNGNGNANEAGTANEVGNVNGGSSGNVEKIETQGTKIDLNPEALEIDDIERKFIDELSPILGRSPRALKRFVNTYRLLKSSIKESDQASFYSEAGENAEFKIAMFLLAVATNAPELSYIFFTELDKLASTTSTQKLTADDWKPFFNNRDCSKYLEWNQVNTFLQSNSTTSIRTIETERMKWWLRRVVRFSFFIEAGEMEWLGAPV